MDVLRTWVDKDSKQERAKLYRNIDPESICIVGHTIYFELTDCPFFVTDSELIKQEMKRFNFTGDLGYYNQTAELKK